MPRGGEEPLCPPQFPAADGGSALRETAGKGDILHRAVACGSVPQPCCSNIPANEALHPHCNTPPLEALRYCHPNQKIFGILQALREISFILVRYSESLIGLNEFSAGFKGSFSADWRDTDKLCLWSPQV